MLRPCLPINVFKDERVYTDKLQSLSPECRRIICEQGTEPPFSGVYEETSGPGSYLCRRCGLALFRTPQQFNAGCGWPAFDDPIPGTVGESQDSDGQRTEIHCMRCQGHLGHVFHGERFTAKNTRHCVNSLSLDFVPDLEVFDTDEALVAGGCFWGVDYFMGRIPGVLKVDVGYTHGSLDKPSYRDICRGDTGHYEATRIVFDREKISYKDILKHFFEIHDPTQIDGQGPDRGLQYQSAIFYYHAGQKKDAEDLIALLEKNGYVVVSRVLAAKIFWKAEEEHQAYYDKHQSAPYCHLRVKRF